MGVIRYYRFRDDILVVLDDWSQGKATFKHVVDAALPEYKVERESYGLNGVTMMDVWLGKCPHGISSKVHWEPPREHGL